MSKSLVEAQEELDGAVRELGRVVWVVWRPILEAIDRALMGALARVNRWAR